MLWSFIVILSQESKLQFPWKWWKDIFQKICTVLNDIQKENDTCDPLWIPENTCLYFSHNWLWTGDHHSTVSNDLRSMVALERRAGQGHRCRLLLWKTVKLIGPYGNRTCNLRFINFTGKQTFLCTLKVSKLFSSKCDSCMDGTGV